MKTNKTENGDILIAKCFRINENRFDTFSAIFRGKYCVEVVVVYFWYLLCSNASVFPCKPTLLCISGLLYNLCCCWLERKRVHALHTYTSIHTPVKKPILFYTSIQDETLDKKNSHYHTKEYLMPCKTPKTVLFHY